MWPADSVESWTSADLHHESVADLLDRAEAKYPKHPALVQKDSKGTWRKTTYAEYKKKVTITAKAFIQLGLAEQGLVAILAHNCPEWMYTQLGANMSRAAVAGIYTSNSEEAVFHVLESSKASICVVGDSQQMDKVRTIRSRLTNLKAVIQIDGPFDDCLGKDDGYYKWSDLADMSSDESDRELSSRRNRTSSNDCCSVVYTDSQSSTNDDQPNGPMISHDGLIWNTQSLLKTLPNKTYGDEIFISYLPLNNVASQIFEIFLPLALAGTVYFTDKDALEGSLLKVLSKVRPTRLYGVPKIWEMLMEKIVSMENESYVFKTLLNHAKKSALYHHGAAKKGKSLQINPGYWLAKKILNSLKSALGLNRCRYLLTGCISMPMEVKKYFLSIDMKIADVYGMSETSGGICFGDDSIPNLEAVGKITSEVEVKVYKPNKRGEGEICIRGRCLFMGYLNGHVGTLQDGWFHSGDLGRIDRDGYLYVAGRVREVITTQTGESITPSYLEKLVKNELPGLSNAFLVKDGNNHLSVLVTIKTEMNQKAGTPLDKLHPDSMNWMQSLCLPYTHLSHILLSGPCPIVRQSIEDGIKRANLNATSTIQRIRKFTILPHDFSVTTDELGNKTFFYDP